MNVPDEIECNLTVAGHEYRMAREKFFLALGVAEMEGGIRDTWKKVEPMVPDQDTDKVFGIISIALAYAWKKGYEAALKPGANPLSL